MSWNLRPKLSPELVEFAKWSEDQSSSAIHRMIEKGEEGIFRAWMLFLVEMIIILFCLSGLSGLLRAPVWKFSHIVLIAVGLLAVVLNAYVVQAQVLILAFLFPRQRILEKELLRRGEME